MVYHTPPLKKVKKQGEMPLPSLGPIPLIKGEFRDGMGQRLGNGMDCSGCSHSMNPSPASPYGGRNSVTNGESRCRLRLCDSANESHQREANSQKRPRGQQASAACSILRALLEQPER